MLLYWKYLFSFIPLLSKHVLQLSVSQWSQYSLTENIHFFVAGTNNYTVQEHTHVRMCHFTSRAIYKKICKIIIYSWFKQMGKMHQNEILWTVHKASLNQISSTFVTHFHKLKLWSHTQYSNYTFTLCTQCKVCLQSIPSQVERNC
jgi:hypothetical protein